MKYIRRHKKLSIFILSFLIIFLLVASIYGRYIHNIIQNYILETKAFYFNSSILNINGKNYSITNWDGVNTYPLTIDLNNRKSDDVYTTTDIEYTISYECPSTVRCTLSKTTGIIHPLDATDSYQISVTPLSHFGEGDAVTITTAVESTSPYHKRMYATYTIGVERSDFSYEIVDSVNSKYLTINFTNSVSFYEVEEAFGDYSVGDHISLDQYNSLSASDQEKCFSAIVSISYNPNDLLVDMTNDAYLHRLSSNYYETTIDNYQWVSGFSFKINASSSSSILFYKNDITKNYTYPIVNDTPIINVSVQLVND